MRKILSFIGIALAIACLLFVGDIFLEIYKEHPGFFSENSWLFWLYVLSMLTAVGMIFHRWLPQGRPRKTVVERTRNGRTLLFDKNEELQRVGFFDKIQGEFIVMFCVIALYIEDVIKGKLTGCLLFVVMSGIMWFISRPPYDLRHAPDKIYGTKDSFLVMRRGATESIPYSRIARHGHEAIAKEGIIWYGYTIVLCLTRLGQSDDCIRFFMTTPTRWLDKGQHVYWTSLRDALFIKFEPVLFEEDLDECIWLHNVRAAVKKPWPPSPTFVRRSSLTL